MWANYCLVCNGAKLIDEKSLLSAYGIRNNCKVTLLLSRAFSFCSMAATIYQTPCLVTLIATYILLFLFVDLLSVRLQQVSVDDSSWLALHESYITKYISII